MDDLNIKINDDILEDLLHPSLFLKTKREGYNTPEYHKDTRKYTQKRRK